MTTQRERPPNKSPILSVITTLIATLGGYIKRFNSNPGPQTTWIGLQRLHDLAWAWQAFGPGSRRDST